MSNREIGPVAKDLIDAKARIEDLRNWCTQSYYDGDKRCAVGALINSDFLDEGKLKFAEDLLRPHEKAIEALKDSSKALFGTMNIYSINDNYGHQEVMQVYDHAIQRALNEGK